MADPAVKVAVGRLEALNPAANVPLELHSGLKLPLGDSDPRV